MEVERIGRARRRRRSLPPPSILLAGLAFLIAVLLAFWLLWFVEHF